MITIVGIDPGGRHVGFCELVGQHVDAMFAEVTEELRPDDLPKRLLATPKNAVWVCESFRLQPDKAMAQVGSDMPTSKLIGVVEYLAKTTYRRLVMQPPSIKKPTEGLMKHKGIPFQSVKRRVGGHARDAEMHAWYMVLRNMKGNS